MPTMSNLPLGRRAQQVTLSEDMVLEQWTIPAGTVVTTLETPNFGWLLLPEGTRTTGGHIIPKRLFKQ